MSGCPESDADPMSERERRLRRLPPFDDVRREIFRVAREIEAADCRPRLVESGEGGSLLRSCHGQCGLT